MAARFPELPKPPSLADPINVFANAIADVAQQLEDAEQARATLVTVLRTALDVVMRMGYTPGGPATGPERCARCHRRLAEAVIPPRGPLTPPALGKPLSRPLRASLFLRLRPKRLFTAV